MALAVLVASGPAPTAPPRTDLPGAVELVVSGCGHAPGEVGSAVPVDTGLLVTAAHVVAAAKQVTATGEDGRGTAEVVALDTRRDLAVLTVPGAWGRRVPMAGARNLEPGDKVSLVTATSGTLRATVLRDVRIGIEAVRSDRRVARRGYQVTGTVRPGDSGAGAFTADGRLAGVVFATGDDGTTWLTSAAEVTALVQRIGDAAPAWHCDPGRSRLVRPTASPASFVGRNGRKRRR